MRIRNLESGIQPRGISHVKSTVPTKDMTNKVEHSRIAGEGGDEHEETYTEGVLADKDAISQAS